MSQEIEILDSEKITNKIYTVKGKQVMLDRDLADLYQTETRTLKQAVKRNVERFPDDFMFELNDDDIAEMVSQSVIPSKSYFGGAKPFAFTEQGVSMLSAVIKTAVAVDISLKIIRAFVNMRRFLSENGQIFQRLDLIEKRQIDFESKADDKFNALFNALEEKSIKATQGIFFDGQVFDAYVFIADLIKTAKESIILIDNFIDETVLLLLSKRNDNCKVTIYTKAISEQLKLDLKKYNAQYPKIEIKIFNDAHDRFMILDEKEMYLIGASLKDLGKKWFAFSKLEADTLDILRRLENGK